MTETLHLALPMIAAAQAQKHITHNEALRSLDALVMLSVLDRNLSAPPGSPAEGARYLVEPTGTGAFAGKDGEIAHFRDGAWGFHVPRPGWVAYVADEEILIVFNGSSWEPLTGGISSLQDVPLLGLATVADSTNPLSAVLNNALFAARTVADGGDGDLRYKLSKATAGDTVSLLFQDNFSGRAEIGLAGDDDLHLKVSSDGSTWRESLVIAAATGRVSFPQGATGLREMLTANRTYYVRSDGSDSNTGLANTSGGAFATIPKALAVVSALDCSIYDVTIQVGNATWTTPLVWRGHLGSGTVTLRGDPSTPSNVTLSTASVSCLLLSAGTKLTISGIKFTTTTSGDGIEIACGAVLTFGTGVEFGACATFHVRNNAGHCINYGFNYAISGGAGLHYYGAYCSTLEFSTFTVTLSGTPSFVSGFFYITATSITALWSITFSGSATGKRYTVELNSVLNSYGAGTASTYFPGNSSGTTATGGQQT